MAEHEFRSERERDLAGELARLAASGRYDEPPGLPLAPLLPADLNAREQVREVDEYHRDDGADAVVDQACAAHQEYQTVAPRVRLTRGSVIAIVGLALLGAAGTYREMSGGSDLPPPPPTIMASNEPHKVGPPLTIQASDELHKIGPTAGAPPAKNKGKARQVGADITGSIEKLVSREEQPVTIEPPRSTPRSLPPRVSVPAAAKPPPAGQAVPNQAMPHAAAAADPRAPPPAIAVASQSTSQSGATEVTAPANHTYVAAIPIAPAEATGTATVTPSVTGSGYEVQLASERSENRAQAALQALQAKYPIELSGRQPIIRRADLEAKGTHYRALVGPFASREEAAGLCSRLKAAGGDCIVQRN